MRSISPMPMCPTRKNMTPEPVLVGWREWVALPNFLTRPLRAKIDSGATTCALHAFYVESFKQHDEPWVRFGLHPNLHTDQVVHCEAPLLDYRSVRDSRGRAEERHVIATTLHIGHHEFITEVTLTNREPLRYRMLIGRNALRGRFLIDSAQSYVLGKPDRARSTR